MTGLAVVFHPAAVDEAHAVRQWYLEEESVCCELVSGRT